LLELGEVS